MNSRQLGEALVLKCYDLIKFSLPTIERIPRKYKFTFGDRLHNLLSDLLEGMIEAQYTPRGEKLRKLHQVKIQLTKLRFFLRLGKDMNLYSAEHLATLAGKVDDIGRRLGQWVSMHKS